MTSEASAEARQVKCTMASERPGKQPCPHESPSHRSVPLIQEELQHPHSEFIVKMGDMGFGLQIEEGA